MCTDREVQGRYDMSQIDDTERMRRLQAGLEQIRQEFIATLPGRLETLDALMDALFEENRDQRAVVEEISQIAHKLHGQAGAFGFGELGQVAAKLEHAAVAFLEGPPQGTTDAVEGYLVTLLDMIDDSLQAA